MDRLSAARVLIEIVDRGSMIAAAEALDMSRAMVTRYLAEMEAWCGVRLLHRTTRRISLTAAGEVTLTRCREMLAVADEMVAVGQADPSAPHGLLRLACSHFLAQTALAGAVAAFLLKYPRVSIDLQVDNRAVNLVEQRIDLAIRITNELDPGLIARRLGDCDSVICAAPAYLARAGTPRTPADLATHNCLTYSYFGKSTWRFDHGGEGVQVAVGGNWSANESMALLAAAGAGAGIAMQPRVAAAPLLASGQLVALLPGYRPQHLGIYGVYSSREHMPPALRAMLDHLLDWFGSDPEWQGGEQERGIAGIGN